MDLTFENYESLKTNQHWKEAYIREAEHLRECDILYVLKSTRALLNTSSSSFLKQADRLSIERAIAKYLRTQTQTPPRNLLTALVRTATLAYYLEKGYRGRDRAALLKKVNYLDGYGEGSRSALAAIVKKRGTPETEFLSDFFKWEIPIENKIHLSYVELLNEVAFSH